MSTILTGLNNTVPDFVTRYAPLVWLHSDDPFRPADLLEHLHHTTPTIDGQPVPDVPVLDLDNLAELDDASTAEVALTSKDDVTEIPEWLLGKTPDETGRISDATPCVVILVEKSAQDIDAFFFYFYSYDRGPNITQVMEPLDGLIKDGQDGMHFGDHVGDWEHNMVRFRDGQPTGIYYSQHRDGRAYDWDHKELSMKDSRPLVYSAYGSHANYPSPGDQIHDIVIRDYCDDGQLWDPVLSAYFYHLDPSTFVLTRLSPSTPDESPISSNLTSFFYFKGRWGDIQYPDDDPRQLTVPYFGLKRFVTGPQGPIVKHLVRKGLAPDKRRKLSWTEWGVKVFMSVYPCCIRGWRKWLYGILAVALLIVIILGIRYAVKKRRARKYQRVDTEIPLEDLSEFVDDLTSESDASERRSGEMRV